MTAVIVSDAPQGSPEWLAARRGGITGTDIGALLGHNPWRTPLDVWLSKRDDHTPDEPNELMRWGQRLEPVVRDHYAAQHGTIVEEVPGLLAHPDEQLLRGSLDGLAHNRDATVVLEVKCTRQTWADDHLPDMYLTQALWYLGITGLQECHVAVLTAGQSYSERVVHADERWFDVAANRALDWWVAHVEGQSMPELDPVRDAPNLPRLWTPDPLESVDLDPDLFARLLDARSRAASGKREADELAARIQIQMGSAAIGYVDGDLAVRWSAVKGRESVSVKELRAVAPDVAAQVVRVGEPSRTFRVVKGIS